MKSQFLKSCYLLPIIWFIIYVVFAIFGGLATIFGATDAFYCAIYCKIGMITFLIITGVFVAYNGVKYINNRNKKL